MSVCVECVREKCVCVCKFLCEKWVCECVSVW